MRWLPPTLLAAALTWPGATAHADIHLGKSPFHVFVLADELELGYPPADLPLAWDAKSWMGGDYNRLWIQTEGETLTRQREGEMDLELFYGRLFAPFWEIRFGVRGDLQAENGSRDMRGHFALGIEGLIPYRFEFEPTLYVTHRGKVSASVEASYSLRITQMLVLQPKTELNVAAQSAPKFGVGAGFNDLEVSARLRYEIIREVAPYAGFEWKKRFGETADLARDAGQDIRELKGVVGVRVWY